jgi:hypothetical protein
VGTRSAQGSLVVRGGHRRVFKGPGGGGQALEAHGAMGGAHSARRSLVGVGGAGSQAVLGLTVHGDFQGALAAYRGAGGHWRCAGVVSGISCCLVVDSGCWRCAGIADRCWLGMGGDDGA